MQSDGGLVEFSGLSGLRAILSGPAGGCVGYARTAYVPEDKKAVIGFDMGGTSTDVSRYGYSPMPRLTLGLIGNTKGSPAVWSRCSKPQQPESLFKAPS